MQTKTTLHIDELLEIGICTLNIFLKINVGRTADVSQVQNNGMLDCLNGFISARLRYYLIKSNLI